MSILTNSRYKSLIVLGLIFVLLGVSLLGVRGDGHLEWENNIRVSSIVLNQKINNGQISRQKHYTYTQAVTWNKETIESGTFFACDYGDIDGDGDWDIALAGNPGLVVVLNNSGSWDSTVLLEEEWGRSVKVTDIDGDGRCEVIAANDEWGFVIFKKSSTGWNLTSVFDSGSTPIDVNVGDFNNDGKDDLLLTDAGWVYLGLWNVSTQKWDAKRLNTNITLGGTHDVEVSDLNGDNKLDIVMGTYETNQTIILWNNGNATWDAEPIVKKNKDIRTVHLEDLNNDGKKEILFSVDETLFVSYQKNNSWELLTLDEFNSNDFIYSLGGLVQNNISYVFIVKGPQYYPSTAEVYMYVFEKNSLSIKSKVKIGDVSAWDNIDGIASVSRNDIIYVIIAEGSGCTLFTSASQSGTNLPNNISNNLSFFGVQNISIFALIISFSISIISLFFIYLASLFSPT